MEIKKDNKVYFIEDENCKFVLKYLDLNENFKENIIESFNAEGQSWC